MAHSFTKQNTIVQQFYDNIQPNRPAARKVGWTDKNAQFSRFKQLTNITSFFAHTLLDVGCGLGALHTFLIEDQLDAKYTGIDINPQFIKEAQKQHPSATFKHADIFDPNFYEEYDYILASGIFNQRVPKQMKYIEKGIQKMVQLCRYGVAFNILSSSTPKHMRQSPTFHYYSPSKVLDICLKYSPYVVLKQHYLPNDMTFYIYKEPIEQLSTIPSITFETDTPE